MIVGKISSLTIIGFVLLVAIVPARAADDASIARLATCQDSWLDWQTSDPARLKRLGDYLHANFAPSGNDPFIVPKTVLSIDGLRIAQVFPDSVGMGVGFSLTVDAPFDKARKVFEKALGKSLTKCDASDDMKSCELQIAEKRDFMLMAEDSPKATQTLVGCYYFYEK